MVGKLHEIILLAIIETAARSPGLRGPYVFDERELQAAAHRARAAIEAAARVRGGAK